MNKISNIVFLLSISLLVKSAFALNEVHDFETVDDMKSYQQLTEELRCPKCQNQNLADSNSQISIDMRAKIAELVKEGRSDAEVKDFMVQRYGNFVLYKPPLQSATWLLWWGPLIMLGIGAGVFVAIVARRNKQLADEPASGDSLTNDVENLEAPNSANSEESRAQK